MSGMENGLRCTTAPVARRYKATTVMRNTSKAVPRQALVGQNVSLPAGSTVKLSTTDLDNLMQALDIDVIALTEMLVPQGHRAEMGMIDAPAIHYNLSGVGNTSINGGPKISLSPHL